MYKKLFFILLAFTLTLNLFAYNIVKKIGSVSVTVGDSNRQIMPFLEKIVASWGKYFERIYADYRKNKIFININANGSYLTFEEIKNASCAVVDEVMRTYPFCDANVTVFAHPCDKSWQRLEWVVQDGKIADFKEE